MTTAIGKTQCITCGKEKATSKCEGCLQNFCLTHLVEHRQQLSRQLDEIEIDRDLFRETLNQGITELQRHPLIQKINEWEEDSIQKIRQASEETRQLLLKHSSKYINHIEEKLIKLTNQLRQGRKEDDITENDLNRWKEELKQLTEQFTKPLNITIQQSSTPLINNIHIEISGEYINHTCVKDEKFFFFSFRTVTRYSTYFC
jgi:ribosome recycling factor